MPAGDDGEAPAMLSGMVNGKLGSITPEAPASQQKLRSRSEGGPRKRRLTPEGLQSALSSAMHLVQPLLLQQQLSQQSQQQQLKQTEEQWPEEPTRPAQPTPASKRKLKPPTADQHPGSGRRPVKRLSKPAAVQSKQPVVPVPSDIAALAATVGGGGGDSGGGKSSDATTQDACTPLPSSTVHGSISPGRQDDGSSIPGSGGGRRQRLSPTGMQLGSFWQTFECWEHDKCPQAINTHAYG